MLYAIREKFSRISKAIGKAFSGTGLSPNQLSLISIPLALITVALIILQSFWLAALFLIITAFWDLVDGAVARETGKATKFGGYLDGVVDKYVETIIALSLLFVPLPAFFVPAAFWIALYVFGEMNTTYAKAAAVEKGASKTEIRGGILERPERTIILLIGILLASFGLAYLTYIIVILAVLSNVTVLQRILLAHKASLNNRGK
ncbi:MAG: CDP-alcohol phosphatidyltransferase family protein [archaeon]